MKKMWVLFLMVLLAACSGGGGGGGEPTAQNGQSGIGTGLLTVTLDEGTAKSVALAEPQGARIVVWKPANTTAAYKEIKDVPLETPSVTFMLPAGDGYIVEAVTYAANGVLRKIVKYAHDHTGRTITVGGVFNATLTVVDIAAPTLTAAPNPLTANAVYAVSATIPQTDGQTLLQDAWSLATKTTGFMTTPHHAGPVSTTHMGLTAPNEPAVYLDGEFFIDPRLTNTATEAQNWTYNVDAPAVTVNGFDIGGLGAILADTYPPHLTSFSVVSPQPSTSFTNITIAATDNLMLTGYNITATATTVDAAAVVPPAVAPIGSGGWRAPPVTTFDASALGLQNGDVIRLWAWARDGHGNISTEKVYKDVSYDASPVMVGMTTPNAMPLQTSGIPVSIQARSYTGAQTPAQYYLTDTYPGPLVNGQPDPGWKPDPADLLWAAAPLWTGPAPVAPGTVSTQTASYNYPGVAGYTRSLTSLYAWVKDANGVSSMSKLNLYFDQSPQVTGLAYTNPVLNSATFTISAFTLKAFAGNTVNAYMIKEGVSEPAPGDAGWTTFAPVASYSLPAPVDYAYSGILPSGSRSKPLSIWVRDSNNEVGGVSFNVFFTMP